MANKHATRTIGISCTLVCFCAALMGSLALRWYFTRVLSGLMPWGLFQLKDHICIYKNSHYTSISVCQHSVNFISYHISAMGCQLWGFCNNWRCYNDPILYIALVYQGCCLSQPMYQLLSARMQGTFFVCPQPMRDDNVTSSLIGCAHLQNGPWGCAISIVWIPFWNLHGNVYLSVNLWWLIMHT